MCGLLHAAPKNHLLGKHPFPPCLFYAWLICQERPRGSMWLPPVLSSSLCVSFYFMHRNGAGGHRIGAIVQVVKAWHIQGIFCHLGDIYVIVFYHFTCYLAVGIFWAPSTWASCNKQPWYDQEWAEHTANSHFISFQTELLQAVLLFCLCKSSMAAPEHEGQ